VDPHRQLEGERADTVRRLAALRADVAGVVEASRDSNADDEHDPEGQTIAFERSQAVALVEQAQRHLVEVEAALARLDAGRYGVCESCARDIPAERLAVRPTARTCVGCTSQAPSRGTRGGEQPRS
jgi:RNA polymerase-binding transcription factor DksA